MRWQHTDEFYELVNDYLSEAYRRGQLDGMDAALDGAAPNRGFNETAVNKVAGELWQRSKRDILSVLD